jgi:hypothetical protein
VAALGLALLVGGEATAAAKKKKKNSVVAGSVLSVQAEADGSGKITVKTKANKKKMTEGKEVTVSIPKDAKIERVTGKKGAQQRNTGTFSDVRTGSSVVIHTAPGSANQAASLEIKKGKKKNS